MTVSGACISLSIPTYLSRAIFSVDQSSRPKLVVMPSQSTSDGVFDDPSFLVFKDSCEFMKVMIHHNYTPETPDEIIGRRCCMPWCSAHLTISDIVNIRCAFFRSLTGKVTRMRLMECIYAFVHSRLTLPLRVDDYGGLMEVSLNRSFSDKPVCHPTFLAVLCVSHNQMKHIIECIASGDSFVTARKGAVRRLGDRTCRAIARIAVESSTIGQYNPMSGALMLGRNVSKKYYTRTNSRGATLSKSHLRDYVGLDIKRRGVDSFMRCDICVTLGQEYERVATLVRLISTKSTKEKTGVTSLTAQAHRAKIISHRKHVLFSLYRRYPNAQKRTAKKRGAIEGREVDVNEISINECVPDSDVETTMYCKLINASVRKDQPDFNITPAAVRQSEILELDDDSLALYVNEELNDHDFSLPKADNAESGNGDGDNVDDEMEMGDGDGGDAGTDASLRSVLGYLGEVATRTSGASFADAASRRAELLSALERLMVLRCFHNEHIVAERIITYAAFETAALMPSSVVTIAADGLSKDKTKVPRKEKSKNDETVGRLDCFVTGVQMSVPRVAEKPLASQVRLEQARRRELTELENDMRANPSDYTDDEKREVEDEMRSFDDKDTAASSGYSLVNHDFLYPFGEGGPPKTDALVSNILHLLASDHVPFIPRCLAIVLDNAAVNKSIYTLRAFALILELIPRLQEVHLLFPTVGHTHNSLDAHFGVVCKAIDNEDIGTPHDLARVIEKVKDSHAYVDFGYYCFAKDISHATACFEFDYLSQQHHFLIYKDSNQDVRFDNKAFLRFAESLSHRVNYISSMSRDLIPLDDEDMKNGCFVFMERSEGKQQRIEFAKSVFPIARDVNKFTADTESLLAQLESADMCTTQREADLASLLNPRPFDELDERGISQENMLAMRMRLKGRSNKTNQMVVAARRTFETAFERIGVDVIDKLLECDVGDGTLRKYFVDKLRECAKRDVMSSSEKKVYDLLASHVEAGGDHNVTPAFDGDGSESPLAHEFDLDDGGVMEEFEDEDANGTVVMDPDAVVPRLSRKRSLPVKRDAMTNMVVVAPDPFDETENADVEECDEPIVKLRTRTRDITAPNKYSPSNFIAKK